MPETSCRPSWLLLVVLSLCLQYGLALQEDTLAARAQAGSQALQAGRYQEAVTIYQELVGLLPDNPGIKMNLGLAHFFAGEPRQAIQFLRQSAGQPGLEPALLFLGASYMQTGRAKEAVPTLRRYLKGRPDDVQARTTLADALSATQRFAEAAVEYEALVEKNPQDPAAWHGLGRSYEALAQEAFERLDSQAPESAYWLVLVAESRMAQRQFRSAFFLYRKALELDPKMRGVHVAIAHIYRQTEHPDWAAQEEALEGELGPPDCETEPSVCEFIQGRHRALVARLRESETPASYYWRSRAYNHLAGSSFAQLGKLPPSFVTHQLAAELHSQSGRHLEASQEWKKALEFSPANPMAQRQLALELVQSRSFDEATPLVAALLQTTPGDAVLNFLAGDLRLNQQDAEGALPFLEKAVRSDPGLLAAHASLGRALLNLGQQAKAIPHLSTALPNDSDGSTLFQLAGAYRATGQTDLARDALEKYQAVQRARRQSQAQAEADTQITPPQ